IALGFTGDYGMIDIGPYDFWAIEYGYTSNTADLKKILSRCNEPELAYATDEDTSGPDPLARRYDFAKDPRDYCEEQMQLIRVYRERILDKFVKDGDSWAKARRGYELTLSLQTRSLSMMSNWIGGSFINRAKKGDPGNIEPVTVVPPEQQRAALKFVIDNAFEDDAFGLTTELLAKMSVDKWNDLGASAMTSEGAFPVHDRVLGIQSTALTSVMNPTTLRRVYDNELRLAADVDTLTLPELLDTVTETVWSELEQECPKEVDNRRPVISSLRRNLQREHVQRLLDLVLTDSTRTAAYRPITDLARMQLRGVAGNIEKMEGRCDGKLDAYTASHLSQIREKITKALQAGYTYGGGNSGGGAPMLLRLGQPTE
ncbi:MAG: zinc-dependent metalloprotease, partial [Planctomycetota bacterium]